jgi:hypothetical protein
MGKHAAAGYGRFTRELSSFAMRLLVVAVLFFGAIFVLVTYVPDWLGDEGDDAAAQPAVESTTTTTEGSPSSVLGSAVSQPSTTSTAAAPETTTTTVPVERPATDIVVLILNSTDRGGLAATATAVLANLGYQMVEPANSTPTLPDSQIQYAPGFGVEAYTLAGQFPDGEVVEYPTADPPADIVVILGTSYVP